MIKNGRLIDRFKWPIKRVLERYGLDLRFAPTLGSFLRSRNVDVVIDVGANEGQFAIGLRKMGYNGTIASFEPVRSVFQALSKSAANDRNWKVRQLALGDANGVAEIQVSEFTVFSSIMQQTTFGRDFHSGAKPVRCESIAIARLDTIFPEIAGQNTFLKIDTQGFEKKVIDGAESCLARLVGIQLELPVVHLYNDTWRLSEAIAFMQDKGFILSQVRPTNFMHADPSLVEIDCVFRRATLGEHFLTGDAS
jgi:FkbM family methyltransferase